MWHSDQLNYYYIFNIPRKSGEFEPRYQIDSNLPTSEECLVDTWGIEPQLSECKSEVLTIITMYPILVTPMGLEPTTSALKVQYSKPFELRSHSV